MRWAYVRDLFLGPLVTGVAVVVGVLMLPETYFGAWILGVTFVLGVALEGTGYHARIFWIPVWWFAALSMIVLAEEHFGWPASIGAMLLFVGVALGVWRVGVPNRRHREVRDLVGCGTGGQEFDPDCSWRGFREEFSYSKVGRFFGLHRR